MKVIDAAVLYGYDSPDSFSRAFRRFHGVLPSQAGHPGVTLQSFPMVKFAPNAEVKPMLEYKIVEKSPFTVVGYKRPFLNDTSYHDIPLWWEELMQQQLPFMPIFGLCTDKDGHSFDYLVADLYAPWKDVPEGCATHFIPGGTWAVFPCTQQTLQATNTRMWAEWLPGAAAWKLSGRYNLEVYGPDGYVELWLPITKA